MQHPDGEPEIFRQQDRNWAFAGLEERAKAENLDLYNQEFDPGPSRKSPLRTRASTSSSITTDSNTASGEEENTGEVPSPQPQIGDVSRVDDEEGSDDDSDSDESSSESVILLDGGDSALDRTADAPVKLENPPGFTNDPNGLPLPAVPTTTEEATKRKRKRKRTPSPPPLKVMKIQPTIRLSLALPKPTKKAGPIINIRKIAQEEGLLVNMSDSEQERSPSDEQQATSSTKQNISGLTMSLLGRKPGTRTRSKPKVKRRVLDRDEGYDKEDPFVDDSELHIDMVKFVGVPEKEGFYVWAGQLPLKEAEEEEKPVKSRKKKTDTATTGGTDSKEPAKKKSKPSQKEKEEKAEKEKEPSPPPHPNAPMQLVGSIARGPVKATATKAKPVSRPSSASVPKASPSVTPAATPRPAASANKPLSESVQAMLIPFRALAKKESFTPKNKFPETLKPPLLNMSLEALHQGDLDDNYFKTLMEILPYNKFTLTKLVTLQIYPIRIQEMTSRQNELIKVLEDGAVSQLPQSEANFETEMAKFQIKYAEWAATKGSDTSMHIDKPNGGAEDDDIQNADPDEPVRPKQKFAWNESLRSALFEYLTIDSEMLRITNEKHELEKTGEKAVTENTNRKKVYAKLVALWPDGWMTSKELSTQWSNARKKHGA